MNQGIQAFNAGKSQKAVKFLKKAGRADPTNDRAFFYQGDILNQMGMRSDNPDFHRKAIKPLLSALTLLPKDAGIHYELGIAYAGADQLEKAITHLDRAFEIDDRHGQSQYRKGRLLEKSERYNEAQEAYYRSIRSRPSILNAYFQLNRLYFRFEQWTHSQKVVEDGIRHHPDEFGLLQDLGLVLEKQEKWVDALNAYNQAIDLNGDEYNLYFLRGRVAYQLEDFQKARRDLKKYLATSHPREEQNQVRKAKQLLDSLKNK
jgi:tetratricopeptide (TPR) repeat protein